MKKTWPLIALASLAVAAVAARHYQERQAPRTFRSSQVLPQAAPSPPVSQTDPAKVQPAPTPEQRIQAAAVAIADYYRGSRQIERARRAMEEMEQFDPAQLRSLARALNTARDFDDAPRCSALALVISYLAPKDSAAALDLLRDLSRRNEGLIPSGDLASQTLSLLLENQPRLALQWLPECSSMLTAGQRERLTTATIVKTSRFDPASSFDLLGQLPAEDYAPTGRLIARTAINPAAKTAVLNALRDYLRRHPPGPEAADTLRQAVMQELGHLLVKAPFESSVAWIDSAGLDEEEVSFLADAVATPTLTEDTGKWIEWLSGKIPASEMDFRLQDMVTTWTADDFLGVERWIGQIENGPVKETATLSYARNTASTAPDSALRAAMTLPPGEKRDEALAYIRQASENPGADQ